MLSKDINIPISTSIARYKHLKRAFNVTNEFSIVIRAPDHL